MEPSRTLTRKYMVPIDLARFHLGDRGMATIRTAESRANAESSFGEVDAVTRSSTYSIKRHPANILLADAALKHQILDETADRIIRESRDHRRVQSEAALQPAGNVVFSAAFPRTKVARSRNALVAGIEAQHDFA